MKWIVTTITLSLAFSAAAKPGEPYVLTGREKSIFGIFQADMKAYPELYKGEDINAYYETFKSLNNLGERKLQLGEELIFPDTAISKQIREAEEAEAAKAAREAAAQERAARAKEQGIEPAAETQQPSYSGVTLFGSDRPSRSRIMSPEEKQERAEAERKAARHKAIYYFQQAWLPHLVYDYTGSTVTDIEQGNIDALIGQAREKVDDDFANALALHAYPDKGIYVLEFEPPRKVDEYFFFAVKRVENGPPSFYSLQRGISFFGAGNASKLYEWQPSREFFELGGRDYIDLPGFLKELEEGPAAPAEEMEVEEEE